MSTSQTINFKPHSFVCGVRSTILKNVARRTCVLSVLRHFLVLCMIVKRLSYMCYILYRHIDKCVI